jgi:MinD superfamily P-loop ATPase
MPLQVGSWLPGPLSLLERAPAVPWGPRIERERPRRFPHAVVDESRCTACAACEDACASGAIRVEERATVDETLCVGCGQCLDACPEEAISLGEPSYGTYVKG